MDLQERERLSLPENLLITLFTVKETKSLLILIAEQFPSFNSIQGNSNLNCSFSAFHTKTSLKDIVLSRNPLNRKETQTNLQNPTRLNWLPDHSKRLLNKQEHIQNRTLSFWLTNSIEGMSQRSLESFSICWNIEEETSNFNIPPNLSVFLTICSSLQQWTLWTDRWLVWIKHFNGDSSSFLSW